VLIKNFFNLTWINIKSTCYDNILPKTAVGKILRRALIDEEKKKAENDRKEA